MGLRDTVIMALDREPMTIHQIAEEIGTNDRVALEILLAIAQEGKVQLSFDYTCDGTRLVGILRDCE